MNWQRVGKKIETLRDMRGFTQKYMGERFGIKQNSYSVLESGKGLNEDRVEEIAEILSVPASELLSSDPFVLTMHNNKLGLFGRAGKVDGYMYVQTDAIKRILH